jgi:L-methionine (R)-S-oxide reductase
MSRWAPALQRTAALLEDHREPLLAAWIAATSDLSGTPSPELRDDAVATLDTLLPRLAAGDVEGFLADEQVAAATAAHAGDSLVPQALAIRAFDRACLPFLLAELPDRAELAECLVALDELGDRRLEILLRAQEDESARRLLEAEEQAARARDHAHEVDRANLALRRSEAQSERRADRTALLGSVMRQVAGLLVPDALLQEAAQVIQARMGLTYVAVVVLDHEEVLVGRWAGRPGVDRRSAGRAQGPARGVIGRALRKRAPQVVGDVTSDPDYHADVPGIRSELAVPLLDGGEPIGAIDVQSEAPHAFDLDDVAACEAIAEFLVIALRNARLVESLKG